MAKIIFMSDVHISEGLSLGKTKSYDWLSQEDRILFLSFLYGAAFDDTVEEVVLVGDIFDTWVFPIDKRPPTFERLIGAKRNATIMDTLTLLSNIKPVIYIPGNHDMTAWDDANKNIIEHRINGKYFSIAGQYEKYGIFATHGHQYFVFNAADVIPGQKLPLGYYISRLAATLAEQGQPRFNVPQAIVKILGILIGGSKGPQIVEGVINYLVEGLNPIDDKKVNDNYQIVLDDGSTITIGQVKEVYGKMFSHWNKQLKQKGLPQESVSEAVHKQISGDSLNPNMCQQLITEQKYNTVIFGHSHSKDNSYINEKDENSGIEHAIGLSVNSGTWCDRKVHTYIEVEVKKRVETVRIADWSKQYGKETTV